MFDFLRKLIKNNPDVVYQGKPIYLGEMNPRSRVTIS